MNDWSKLLLAFREVKFPHLYFGLTPRFIVGACQVPIGKKFEDAGIAYEATKQIFLEMQSYKSDGLIVVSSQCEIHNGPVMRMEESEWTDNAIDTNFDEIWSIYGDDIISGNYHISAEERPIIKTIFDEKTHKNY